MQTGKGMRAGIRVELDRTGITEAGKSLRII